MINDFDALEQRCRTRRNKRILKFSLMAAGSALLALTGWLGWMQFGALQYPSVSTPKPSQPVMKEKPSSTVPTQTDETNLTAAAPSNTQTTPPVQKALLPDSIAASKPVTQVQPAPATPQPVPAAVSALPAPKKNLLEVTTSISDTESLLSTYERMPRYESALAVAKDFYAKGDYPNASVWAKKANHHNREAEEAWILSAKSNYAQGKKAEAIGVLELYLNYKDSKAANELLKTWKR